MSFDFELPQKWINPKNRQHILLVANTFALIRYGQHPDKEVVTVQKDGRVNFPITNDHWLFPPQVDMGQKKNHWRLTARYDSEEKLKELVEKLKVSLNEEAAKGTASIPLRYIVIGAIILLFLILQPRYSAGNGLCLNFMGEQGTRVCSQ
jgi:hypothetical protein